MTDIDQQAAMDSSFPIVFRICFNEKEKWEFKFCFGVLGD